MPRFPFPVLLSDVGGTNARFACIPAPGAPMSDVVRLPTAGFHNFSAAAQAAITQARFPQPMSMLVGAAGPVKDRAVTLTNAAWVIDGPEIARDLGLMQGILLNDFETLSIALPALPDNDLIPIGAGTPVGNTRIVIGPGTGLGVGALIDAGGRYLPVSSEGGHIGIGAESREELAFLEALDIAPRRIQAEMLLAGPGLPGLYRAESHLAASHLAGRPATALDPAGVASAALDGSDPAAKAAIQRMLALLARFSGDMALTFLATGGVYLAGGILPRISNLIEASVFRACFERNERMGNLLARIPVWLIRAEEPAFAGLSALARDPARYLMNYDERCWVQSANQST